MRLKVKKVFLNEVKETIVAFEGVSIPEYCKIIGIKEVSSIDKLVEEIKNDSFLGGQCWDYCEDDKEFITTRFCIVLEGRYFELPEEFEVNVEKCRKRSKNMLKIEANSLSVVIKDDEIFSVTLCITEGIPEEIQKEIKQKEKEYYSPFYFCIDVTYYFYAKIKKIDREQEDNYVIRYAGEREDTYIEYKLSREEKDMIYKVSEYAIHRLYQEDVSDYREEVYNEI